MADTRPTAEDLSTEAALSGELRELNAAYASARSAALAKKAELDAHRVAANMLSTFEEPSVETDEDRAAAAAWAAEHEAVS